MASPKAGQPRRGGGAVRRALQPLPHARGPADDTSQGYWRGGSRVDHRAACGRCARRRPCHAE